MYPRLTIPVDDPRFNLGGRECKVCGCTDDDGCQEPECYWVADDLCSNCE